MALYRFGTPTSNAISTGGDPIQGVCVDPAGGRFWVTLSSQLRRYNGSWTLQDSHTTSSESPTDKAQINGVAYDGSTLFMGANNFNSTTPKKGWILEYDPDTLARIAEHAVEAHWAEGCAIREESGSPEYWVHYHDWTSVSRYDASWSLIGNYTLPGISIYSTDLFQGGFWSGDHLYLIRHNNDNPTMYYVYLWDGSGFDLVEAREAPFLTADYAGQGFSFDEANLTAYWARRINGAPNAPDVLETAMVPYSPATPAPNAWTLITSGMIQGPLSGKSVTIDTTGADLIFIQCNAAAATSPAITDGFGNTVNALTSVTTTGNTRLYRWYIVPTTVGLGHQFTASGITFDSMIVSAFSGAAASPLDVQSTANATTQAGSITPSEDNCLVIASLCSRSVADYTIGSSYTITERRSFVSSICDGGATAYLKQTTASATNPAWSHSGAVAIVAFKPGFSPGTTGTGALSAQSAAIAGTATRTVTGSGVLAAQSATVAGSGAASGETTGTGALAPQASTVAGAATRVVTGSGALAAQAASASGSATRAVAASGALAAQSATISGTSLRTVTGSGAVNAQSATTTGTGSINGEAAGAGVLAAQASTVSGAGTRTVTGSGAVAAQSATVAGTSLRTVSASGALSAGAASVSGSAGVDGEITASGTLNAQSSAVAGTAKRTVTGAGALVAQSSIIVGSAPSAGSGTGLTEADIAAIAEAVWAHPKALTYLRFAGVK